MQRFVEMPAGARKVVMLYLQPEAFQRQVTVQYQEPNGTVQAVVETRVLEQASSHFAIVGDGAGHPASAAELGRRGRPAGADLPDARRPARAIRAARRAVGHRLGRRQLSADRGAAPQHRAMGRQRRPAGHRGRAGLAGAHRRLPRAPAGRRAHCGGRRRRRRRWRRGPAPTRAPSSRRPSRPARCRTRARPRPDRGRNDPGLDAGVGAGRVILVGIDLATDAYRGWEGSRGCGLACCRRTAAWSSSSAASRAEESQNAMGTALSNLPSLEVPPAELLLLVIVAYILLIGPDQLPRPAAAGSTRAGMGHRPAARGDLHGLLVRHRQLAEGHRRDRQPDLADPVQRRRRLGARSRATRASSRPIARPMTSPSRTTR